MKLKLGSPLCLIVLERHAKFHMQKWSGCWVVGDHGLVFSMSTNTTKHKFFSNFAIILESMELKHSSSHCLIILERHAKFHRQRQSACLLLLSLACLLLLLFLACCCCCLIAVLNWLGILMTLPSVILMTHLSYMTLFAIYLIDCTTITSRLSRKESTVTPLYNGYFIILKLKQKHHAKSCVIGWLLVYATTRNKQQIHWYHEKGHWSVGGWQQWCSVAALLKTEFRRRNGCLLILLSLW